MSGAAAPGPFGALVPVQVEGWTLYREPANDWIHDLDLAERAHLKKPHHIRAVIQNALQQGAVTISRTAGNGSDLQEQGPQESGDAEVPNLKAGTILATGENGPPVPLVRMELTSKRIGSGARRVVEEYFLSRDAAVVVLLRLRTAEAKRLQAKLVPMLLHVFALAERARLATVPALTADDVRALIREEIECRVLLERQNGIERNLAVYEEIKRLRASVPTFQAFQALRSEVSAARQQASERAAAQSKEVRTALDALRAEIAALPKPQSAARLNRDGWSEGEAPDSVRTKAERERVAAAVARWRELSPEQREAENARRQEENARQQIDGWLSFERGFRVPAPEGEYGRRFYEAIRAALDYAEERTARVLGTYCDAEGIVKMSPRTIAANAHAVLAAVERSLGKFIANDWIKLKAPADGSRPPVYQLRVVSAPPRLPKLGKSVRLVVPLAPSSYFRPYTSGPWPGPVTVKEARVASRQLPRAVFVSEMLKAEQAGRVTLLPVPPGPVPPDVVHIEDAIDVPGRGLLYYVKHRPGPFAQANAQAEARGPALIERRAGELPQEPQGEEFDGSDG